MKPLAKIVVPQVSRLDKFLNKSLNVSQSKLYALIRNGKVFVNDSRIRDVSFNVSRKDIVSIPFSALEDVEVNGRSKIDFSKFQRFRVNNSDLNSFSETLLKKFHSNHATKNESSDGSNSKLSYEVEFEESTSRIMNTLRGIRDDSIDVLSQFENEVHSKEFSKMVQSQVKYQESENLETENQETENLEGNVNPESKIKRVDPQTATPIELNPNDFYKPIDQTSTLVYLIDLCKYQLDHRNGEVIDLHSLSKRAGKRLIEHAFQKHILFEDSNMMIINKPYGVITIDSYGPPRDRTFEEESDHAMIEGVLKEAKSYVSDLSGIPRNLVKLYPVHRLDKDTTGVIIIAKNPETARTFSRAFERKSVRKCYWSLVTSKVEPSSGSIRMPISRKMVDYTSSRGETFKRELMVLDEANGKPSVTEYQVVKHTQNIGSWLSMYPLTGRTHQLRVHSSIGLNAPIFGDFKYGPHSQIQLSSFMNIQPGHVPKMHLHARSIVLPYTLSIPSSVLNQDIVNMTDVTFPDNSLDTSSSFFRSSQKLINGYSIMNHSKKLNQYGDVSLVILPMVPPKFDPTSRKKDLKIPSYLCIRAPLPDHMKDAFTSLDYMSNLIEADKLWIREFSKSLKKDGL